MPIVELVVICSIEIIVTILVPVQALVLPLLVTGVDTTAGNDVPVKSVP